MKGEEKTMHEGNKEGRRRNEGETEGKKRYEVKKIMR